MTKIEIDGKTYCVETLIYTVERLTKEVKASAEHHRLVLGEIRDEISAILTNSYDEGVKEKALQIIDRYKVESEG